MRQPKEAFHPDILQSTVKNGGGSLMIWDAISLRSTKSNYFLHERINKKDYLQILSNQIHPMAQALFPEKKNTVFQDNNTQIHTARIVKE